MEGGNDSVQKTFESIFDEIDDALAIRALTNPYTNVLGNLKGYRAIKKTVINNEVAKDAMFTRGFRTTLLREVASNDFSENSPGRHLTRLADQIHTGRTSTEMNGIVDCLPESDYEYIKNFHESVDLCILCQRFLQLLCEGHNLFMQDYIR